MAAPLTGGRGPRGAAAAVAAALALGTAACGPDRATRDARASLGAHLGGVPTPAVQATPTADDVATARRSLEAALRANPQSADARAALAALAAPRAAGPATSVGAPPPPRVAGGEVAAGEVVPAPRETPVAKTEAAAAAAVSAAVLAYAAAIESRDVGEIARVYPGITDRERRAWAAFFDSVGDVRARLVADQVTVDGATALARVRGAYEYRSLRPGRAARRPVSFRAALARGPSGWEIRAVE